MGQEAEEEMSKPKLNEIEKIVSWLELEARVYTKTNPFHMKVVVDSKQLRRKLRALVRKAYKLQTPAFQSVMKDEGDKIRFRELFGVKP
jgi:hypothetical protein